MNASGRAKIWEDSHIRKGKLHTQQTAHSSKYPILFDALDFDLPAKLQGLPHLPQRSFAQQRFAKRKEEREHIQEERRSLSMYAHRDALIKAIKQYQVVIVQSETGSEKTAQIPQYLIDECFGSVVCTKPRRVAAMSVATSVAYETGVKLGHEVAIQYALKIVPQSRLSLKFEAAEEILQERTSRLGSKLGELIIAPIYATLPSEMQANIFEPTPEGARRVVLATNIAETSVTIPGILYVIDPGFRKQRSYNAKTGMESLLVVPVSRAGAKQRAGHAGRIQPGKFFRVYTKWSYMNEMEEGTVPELLRTNLSKVVLLLLSLGIDNFIDLDFIYAPPPEALLHSL
ncbi:Pre-mRNA-splicing factor ATP-dependent RNA helicase DEAH1 [Gracilariopsis chorda]|uniref:Pre-mRNA-splicing factor ATP-dependent RNA helicase DEAH1 n=1 Tax=Gracilariopsis chorda TaxID=448386 RepID=A0A2V3ITK7_9FLOR|nr:Pre-mRNA-splicing factor ATP-dependent RNA helicase DEAH1 [Gracilariopsis chorda]|eukprot:PXF45432.1 Pre-mRNA-splicing factor ATP-dependent RNA helicase DEAH1 [Gracilariopsis chorda]